MERFDKLFSLYHSIPLVNNPHIHPHSRPPNTLRNSPYPPFYTYQGRQIRLQARKFDGNDPPGLYSVDEYFDFHDTPPHKRRRLLEECREGQASKWLRWMRTNALITLSHSSASVGWTARGCNGQYSAEARGGGGAETCAGNVYYVVEGFQGSRLVAMSTMLCADAQWTAARDNWRTSPSSTSATMHSWNTSPIGKISTHETIFGWRMEYNVVYGRRYLSCFEHFLMVLLLDHGLMPPTL